MSEPAIEQKALSGKLRRNLHLLIGAAVGAGLVAAVLIGSVQREEGPKQEESAPERPPQPPSMAIEEAIREQKRASAPPPASAAPPPELVELMGQASGERGARRQEDIERERREAEVAASPISIPLAEGGPRAAIPPTPSAVESILLKQAEAAARAARSREEEAAAALRAAAQPPAAKSAARENAEWLEDEARRAPAAQPIQAKRPAWRFAVQAGSVIPAALLTRINSDLPGMVTAQVSADVYDSLSSSVLLIPKGSRLVGRYNSEVRPGQARVLIAFQRIYFPDGRYADLEAMPGADQIGQAGLEDKVDNHFLRMFGASFLIAGISRLFGDRTDITINNFGGGSTVTTDVLGTALSEAARSALERHRNIPPTIVIEEGFRFNVMVSRDLALEPYGRR